MTAQDAAFTRPIAYEEEVDGKAIVVYRASSLGMCSGALVRARLGVNGSAPSDMMQERFDEGHDWEERVLLAGLADAGCTRTELFDHLKLFGRPVSHGPDGWQVECEVAWSNKVIRCHPDAIATKTADLSKRVVEGKFLGDAMYKEKVRGIQKHGMLGLGATYAWQASIEMLSTGLPLVYIIGEKVVKSGGGGGERGREVELGEVFTVEFDEPAYSLKDVKARVLEVEGYVTRGELPKCPVPFMFPCPYWADHEQVDKVVCEDEVLEAWVEVWKLASKAFGTAALDLEYAKKAVAEQMTELGLTGARCAGVDVAVVATAEKGNVSWSKWAAAVKKKHPEVVDVSEDDYRGKATAGYVKISEVKE